MKFSIKNDWDLGFFLEGTVKEIADYFSCTDYDDISDIIDFVNSEENSNGSTYYVK